MSQCSYCSKEYSPGTGFTIFSRLGAARHYCSRKCSRYAEMKKPASKLKWTAK